MRQITEPGGTTSDASYEDGILTFRLPMPEEKPESRRTAPVRRAGGTAGGERP
ncbi:hypothetical protein [Streptomyces sp. NK15101]|uniref:hypothetical protein n=1 Tax=Streptomyces sp. NK15101 TaxID=2873261 RepID=UPI001CEC4029|nr:hypothetical protein [Streptomyces sp. NK15101]